MSDVQVSNARRIGFTALVLVAFAVLGWRAYWMGCDEIYVAPFPGFTVMGGASWPSVFWTHRQLITSLSFAIAPAILLSLSAGNVALILRDLWILTSTILFSVSIAVCYSLGENDAEATYESLKVFGVVVVPAGSYVEDWHEVSLLWLLLPLILTTTFVIFGAWRSAVRDRREVTEDEGVTAVEPNA